VTLAPCWGVFKWKCILNNKIMRIIFCLLFLFCWYIIDAQNEPQFLLAEKMQKRLNSELEAVILDAVNNKLILEKDSFKLLIIYEMNLKESLDSASFANKLLTTIQPCYYRFPFQKLPKHTALAYFNTTSNAYEINDGQVFIQSSKESIKNNGDTYLRLKSYDFDFIFYLWHEGYFFTNYFGYRNDKLYLIEVRIDEVNCYRIDENLEKYWAKIYFH